MRRTVDYVYEQLFSSCLPRAVEVIFLKDKYCSLSRREDMCLNGRPTVLNIFDQWTVTEGWYIQMTVGRIVLMTLTVSYPSF